MAKQMVNPVERHLEKGVLGIAALGLVYVIVQFLVTSPNQIELGSRTVTPGNIDAAVAERAQEVLGRIQNQAPKVEIAEPLFDEFAGSLAPLKPDPLPAVAPFQPLVPLIDPPIDVLGRAKLVEVPRPEAPKISSGRSTIATSVSGSQQYVPVNWATVSALFDYKKQVERQKNTYGATQDQIVVFPMEIQRRMARPDGSFSDGNWEDIDTWPTVPLPRMPELTVVMAGNNPTVPLHQLKEIENFYRSLSELPRQRDCMRPLMAQVVNGTKWTFPIITSYLDVKKQDHQFLSPNDPPSANPADVYGIETVAAAPTTAEPTAEQLLDSKLKEAETLIASAKKNLSVQEAIRANNLALEVSQDRTVSATQRSRAELLRRQADQAQRDVERELMTRGQPQPGGDKGPAAVRRDPLPTQQMWAHDAADGSIKDNATYQYRVRFRIYNQFAGSPEKFDDPQDATKLVLASDWSEPSESVTFEPTSLFFVTYEDKAKSEVGVEFFRWYYGAWLKSRRTKMAIGDVLATEQRTPAPALTDATTTDNPNVPFSADGFVIDLDFSRKSQERKAGRSDGGVSFGQLRDDTALVLMTADGRLAERLVSLDRDHPDKRSATGKLWTPKGGK